MIQIKNHQSKEIKFSGVSEGLNIFVHTINNTANVANTQHDISKISVDWKCTLPSGKVVQVFSGRLADMVQSFMLFAQDATKRIDYINGRVGQLMVAAASGVIEKHVADLSIYHTPYEGAHSILLRSDDVFPSGEDTNSYIQVDFNPSDDNPETPFFLRMDSIEVGSSDKTIRITGNCGGIVYIQSDNKYIASDDAEFNGTSVHPLALATCSSPLFNSMLKGQELQALLVDDLGGIPDFVNSKLLTMQKSVVLSERDLLVNPQLDLQLNAGSFAASGVSYNIVSKMYV